MDPFHSLFLPLGLSPAFFVPNYGWGLCPMSGAFREHVQAPPLPGCPPALLYLLAPPLLLQCRGSSPTWHSACIALFHGVSLTPTCASVSLGHPIPTSPSGFSHSYPCFKVWLPLLKATLWLTWSTRCPWPCHQVPIPSCSSSTPSTSLHLPKLTSVANSLPVPVGQSLAGSSSPVGLVSRG